ncbi:hypothetical protein D9613_004360 [Agrocybe pediades]|uniref:Uncharacterized protein n=1 Tax=Agrocybe pediades TaxID=84607 RepID=A0A8H4QIW8_9AGAR|nr:hypothetical protein D9613_004360 [Agrocybe pediades]KAF9540951.1 hypothetical protein CPC08DRAFT_717214 [Agrocybe pediades]
MEPNNDKSMSVATQPTAPTSPAPLPTATATPTARLITKAADRFRHPAVWGFPVDLVKLGKRYDNGPDAMTYMSKAGGEMRAVCGEIIGEPLNKSKRRWDLGYRVNRKSTENTEYLFAIVTSTGPDPRFVPDEEKIAELKAFFRKYGVTKEPGWYRSTM